MGKEASFNIENGVLTGGDFWGVTHVEIPEGVTCIGTPISYRGNGVFERRKELESVIIPEGVWCSLEKFAQDTVVVVGASEHYSTDGYIRDYDEYMAIYGTL